MTLLFTERKPQIRQFNSDMFIGARGERISFYSSIDNTMTEMIKNKGQADYSKIMDIVYEYSSILISEGNYSEAFNSYFQIYCKLMYGNYLDETKDFIKEIDKTELYYNLGIIAKEYLKDFDSAMYYFGEAGKEHSRNKQVTTEEFFREEMIDKPGRAFWNFSGHIHQNCFGYSSFATPFHFKSVFGYETDKTTVEKLLKDFKYPLFLQFVFTVSSYFKWLSLEHNFVKGVRITRVLGEMSWLFDCYLKQKFNFCGTLKPNLDQFLRNRPMKKSFDNLYNTVIQKNKKDSIYVIEDLLNLQETTIDIITKQSICLLITYVMRNYTSHNFDDQFYTFEDDKYTKKIFFSCLLSFFIVLFNK